MMTTDVDNTPNFDPSAVAFVRDPARPVLTHARLLQAGAAVTPHHHPRGQLLWAVQGVLRVISESSVWIVPPSHAVWIPGGTRHQVVTESAAQTRNLYVDPSCPIRDAAQGCSVLHLTPLLREVILRLVSDATTGNTDRYRRLCEVALDEIAALETAPLCLPGGRDPRLVRLTRHLGQNPADPRPLTALAALAGASPRTMERLFRQETGLAFRQWRSQLKLLAAIERLSHGESSTAIAYALGYSSPSAFVAAFRQHFGSPPQSFLAG